MKLKENANGISLQSLWVGTKVFIISPPRILVMSKPGIVLALDLRSTYLKFRFHMLALALQDSDCFNRNFIYSFIATNIAAVGVIDFGSNELIYISSQVSPLLSFTETPLGRLKEACSWHHVYVLSLAFLLVATSYSRKHIELSLHVIGDRLLICWI